jgi:predicted nucleic acid-binding protein
LIVVAGISGITATSDRDAPESAACQAVLREAGTVVISPLVLTELDHLAKPRFGSPAGTAITDFTLGQVRQSRFQIPETGLEIRLEGLGTARLIQQRYASLDLDLADAVTVVLAGHYRTDAVLTLDRRTSARCVPSPRTSGSGSCPATYNGVCA